MKRILLLLLIVLILPLYSFAKTDGSSIKEEKMIEDVVVTATKTIVSKDKVGGNTVVVITSEEIEAKKLTTVAEVLRTVPGIDIASNGGYGTSTSIFMRGADAKNVLVLVDGVIFNDPSDSNRKADIGSLTLDNIERIEIVKGSQSVLYGSNATGGVINIITKSGKKKPSAYIGLEYGSYNSIKLFAGTSGKKEKFSYSLNISENRSDGFSIANDKNDNIPHNGNTDEDDGWKSLNISGRLKILITENSDFYFNVRRIDSEVDIDEYGDGYAGDRFSDYPYTAEPDSPTKEEVESEMTFVKLGIHNFFLNKSVESNLSCQISDVERTYYDNDGNEYSYSPYKGSTKEFSWQCNWFYNDINTLTFGFNFFTEDYYNQSVSEDIYTNSYYLQDQIIYEGFDIVFGFRTDNHENFGTHTTYRIAPAYIIDSTGTKFKASFGTGFRSPSAFELYSSYGNEDLKAEESTTWDIGIEQKIIEEAVLIGVNFFNMNFDNRIEYSMSTYKYEQTEGETKIKGIEVYSDFYPTDNITFKLSYTYTDTEDPDGEQLTRRPEHKTSFNTNYRFSEKAGVNCEIIYAGKRKAYSGAKDKDGNSVDNLDSYILVNLAGEYRVSKNLKIYARIDNLFDEDYEICWSYATPGLSAYMGLKVEI